MSEQSHSYLITRSAGFKLQQNFLKCNICTAGPVGGEGVEGLVSDGGDVLHSLVLAQSQLDIIRGQLAAATECGIVTQQGSSGQLAVTV